VDTDFAARREELVRKHLRPAAERPRSKARGVHHFALICSDPDRTIAFYQDVLGFPLVELIENRDYPGSTHFFIDVGHETALAFFDFPGLGLEPVPEGLGGVQHVAISVEPDAYTELVARLDAEGIEYLGPDRGLEKSVYFKDPDGIQIEITSVPLQSMDFD
jgi:glyoxylase I family protein